MFPSTEGLILIDASGLDTVLTKKMFTPAQWTALNPDDFIAFQYQGKYVAFEAGSVNVHIIDYENGVYEKGQLTYACYGGYQDKATGTIYIITGDGSTGRKIINWRGGTAKNYSWTSKVHQYPSKQFFSRMKLEGDFSGETSATVTLTVDGVARTPITVSDSGLKSIGRFWGNNISYKIAGQAAIKQIIIGASAREVLSV